MNAARTRIRRWASHLPDELVILSILLLALFVVCSLMAAIVAILIRLLDLAGGNERGVRILGGIVLALGILLAIPMIVVFAYLLDFLEGWVGTRCPGCGQRELEWRSGNWKYGNPPDYQYFSCPRCGAIFRQLCGGQGVLSDLERIPDPPEAEAPTAAT